MKFRLTIMFLVLFSSVISQVTEKNKTLEELFLWDRSYRRNCEWDEIKERDTKNQQVLNSYLLKFGAPQCSDSLSVHAYYGYYYTIQHAGVEWMEEHVNQIKLLAECECLEMKKYAMMIDRIAVTNYGYQIYGEQRYHDTIDNYLKYFPFQNKDSVQFKRIQIGLDSLDFEKKVRLIIRD